MGQHIAGIEVGSDRIQPSGPVHRLGRVVHNSMSGRSALVKAAISASLSHPNIVQTFTYKSPADSDSSPEAITTARQPFSSQSTRRNFTIQTPGIVKSDAPIHTKQADLYTGQGTRTVCIISAATAVALGRDVECPARVEALEGPPDSPDPAPNGRFPSPHNSPSSGRQPPKLSTSSSSIDPVGRTHFSRRSLESRHAQRPHWRTSGAGASSNHGGPLFGGTPRSSLPDRSRSGAPSSHQAPHCGSKGAASLNPTSGFEVNGTLNYKGVVDTAMDAARAMIYIHKSGIVHADLKARNVLLKGANDKGKGFISLQVADFGLSAKLEPRETKIYGSSKLEPGEADIYGSCKGTLTHMAPELMLEGTKYDKGIPNSLLGHHVVKLGKRPEFPPGCHSGYVNLAKLCWTGDFAVRPVFEEVLQALHTIRKTLQEPSS
eukprot:gene11744-5181_t